MKDVCDRLCDKLIFRHPHVFPQVESEKMKDMKVCIVGGGAAGMLAASLIAKNGHDVSLFEKNEKLGKKIYITGKGRCNVTNATTGVEFSKNIINGTKFLMSALARFSSIDTMNFFEDNKVPLKIERGNRVFPVSDKSSDIIKALERAMKNTGVKVFFNQEVKKLLIDNNKIIGIVCDGIEYNFDAVIIATGGISYPSTGSTGDGYKFAKFVGHNIVSPVPSLCAVRLNEDKLSCIEGLSLKNVKLIAKYNQKIHFESEIGEMLFTKNGISGPLVLTMSSQINRCDFENLKIFIDFKPAISYEELITRIDRDIQALNAKQFSSLLEGLIPKSLVPIFAERLNISTTQKANQINREMRKNLVSLLKAFELKAISLEDFNQAVVTSGGVSLKEINPKNMQSKLVFGLYFIGEVLDIDALTGGFNMQLAFSTAAACASDFENLI